MSEFYSDDSESPFRELAETIVNLGQGIIEYRDFIGRKKAALIMEELDIHMSGDDSLEAALTDVFGTCVTTGMTLAIREETDFEAFDTEVKRLNDQLPEALRPSIGRFIPYLIDRGIRFQNDIHADDELLQQWDTEFKLLKSL